MREIITPLMRCIYDAWEAPPLGQLLVGIHWCAFQCSFLFFPGILLRILANILSLLMLTLWPPSQFPYEVLPLIPCPCSGPTTEIHCRACPYDLLFQKAGLSLCLSCQTEGLLVGPVVFFSQTSIKLSSKAMFKSSYL